MHATYVTGRIEALNNNWETLVRRGRGYRDLNGMFRKLRFMTVTISGHLTVSSASLPSALPQTAMRSAAQVRSRTFTKSRVLREIVRTVSRTAHSALSSQQSAVSSQQSALSTQQYIGVVSARDAR